MLNQFKCNNLRNLSLTNIAHTAFVCYALDIFSLLTYLYVKLLQTLLCVVLARSLDGWLNSTRLCLRITIDEKYCYKNEISKNLIVALKILEKMLSDKK